MRRLSPIFACLFFIVNPLHAQLLGDETGTTRAVVVGVSDYQDDGIPDLQFAHKDAQEFARFLQSPSGGGVSDDHIQILLNEDATTGNMAAAFDWLVEESQSGDRAIIYFSGHGDVETRTRFQRGFLLTYDSPSRSYIAGAFALIFLQDIISTLSEAGVQVVMVSDACRAGKLAGNENQGTAATSSFLATQFANEVKILSCQPEEFSLEGMQWGGGRGAFSYHLLRGMTGLADRDMNKSISLMEIGRYLEDHVPMETAPHSQLPMTVGNSRTELFGVDQQALAALLEEGKGEPVLASVESRGIEQQVLAAADSVWTDVYQAFEQAMADGRLLEPKDSCAYDLYLRMVAEESLSPLHKLMRRNLAARLQNDAQLAINLLLANDSEALYNYYKDYLEKFEKHPDYLRVAADLLGEGHYIYPSIKAKQLFFQADLLWGKDECEKAIAYIREALTWLPDAPYLYYELGQFEYNCDLEDSAAVHLQKAIDLAPTWCLPYHEMGNFYRLKEEPDLEEAIRWFEKALALDSTFFISYSSLGEMNENAGNLEQAEYHYLQSRKYLPNHLSWLDDLCDLYIGQGRYADALDVAQQAFYVDSLDLEVYNSALKALAGMGQLEKAAQWGEKYEQVVPEAELDAWMVKVIGMLYMDMGQFDKAAAKFEKCMRLNPDYYTPVNYLAEARMEQGRWDDARAILDKMLAETDDDNIRRIHTYMYLGVWESLHGDPALAEAWFAKSEAFGNEKTRRKEAYRYGDNQVAWGHHCLRQARFDEANAHFRQAPGIDDENVSYLAGLAASAMAQGDPDQAADYLEKALQAGYRNLHFIRTNPWLKALAETAEGKELMGRYFKK